MEQRLKEATEPLKSMKCLTYFRFTDNLCCMISPLFSLPLSLSQTKSQLLLRQFILVMLD